MLLGKEQVAPDILRKAVLASPQPLHTLPNSHLCFILFFLTDNPCDLVFRFSLTPLFLIQVYTGIPRNGKERSFITLWTGLVKKVMLCWGKGRYVVYAWFLFYSRLITNTQRDDYLWRNPVEPWHLTFL